MNTVEFLKRKVNVPSTWDEFTPGQFFFLARALMTSDTPEKVKSILAIHTLGLQKHVFIFAGKHYYVTGISRYFQLLAFRKIARGKAYMVPAEEIYFVSRLFDFLFTTIEKKKQPPATVRNVMITRNHLPVLKNRFKKLLGPRDYMADSTMAEYIIAENHYQQFIQNGDVEQLNLLCASLYRPIDRTKKNTTPKRIAIDDDYTHFQKYIKKTPIHVRFAILLFFEGVRNNLACDYDHVFVETDPDQSTIHEDDDNDGWPAIISSIAGHVSKVDEILEINMHTFFFDLNKQIKDARKPKFNKSS